MKLLMFYTHTFSFKTAAKGLAEAPDAEAEDSVRDGVVIFFHVEAEDQEKQAKVIQKFTKNVKWLARKFSTEHVVLHSFNHLSSSKGSPELASTILDQVSERLTRTGFLVTHTPFGYFNEFQMHVAGDSLAKVFKEF